MSLKKAVTLCGNSLTCRDLSRLGQGGSSISICDEAMERVVKARSVIDRLVERGFSEGHVAYGINTGFGLFSDVIIDNDKLAILQTNLIRSHSAGVGAPLSPAETRRLLALRINVLAKGHSGIRRSTVEKMVAAFNHDCLSVVPSQGTVGASGDLAPLSHLALGLMGEGDMWDPDRPGEQAPAADILRRKGIEPITLEAKEGLAMINGTQMMTSLVAEAVVRAESLAISADVACALSVEALQGTPSAFEPCIHATRPHPGQVDVAKRLLALLLPTSDIFDSHRYEGKVQDAYSLRCAPQVHGIAHDTIAFVERLIEVELNSATDNPMVFQEGHEVGLVVPQHSRGGKERSSLRDAEPRDGTFKPYKRSSDTFYEAQGGFVISGGNFHGEYPAKAADYLAIGVAELGSISERRIERLMNPTISGLPAFLAHDPGLDSGFMIAHCTAAGLVSENKVLCHPSSTDSISTSGSKEDHVSMGGFAARKALSVVEHVEHVIAIEVLAACAALDHFAPLKSTPALEAVRALVRAKVAPLDGDRFMAPDIAAVQEIVRSGAISAVAQEAEEDHRK